MKKYTTEFGTLFQEDVCKAVSFLEENSIDLIITSPPYFQQRRYIDVSKKEAQHEIGQEKKVTDYIKTLVNLFELLHDKNILKPTATMFINIGDKYLNKQQAMIPERFALAMKDAGFILRNILIWNKTAFLPTKSEDRFIYAHEPIFFFTVKPSGYYFRKRSNMETNYEYRSSVWKLPINKTTDIDKHFAPFSESLVETILDWACTEKCCAKCGAPYFPDYETDKEKEGNNTSSKVIKSVEKTNALGKTSMFRSKKVIYDRYFNQHKKSCKCNTTKTVPPMVFDPFMGSGTVADVCERNKINWIGAELNPESAKLCIERVLYHQDGTKIPKMPDEKGGLVDWKKIKKGKRVFSKNL